MKTGLKWMVAVLVAMVLIGCTEDVENIYSNFRAFFRFTRSFFCTRNRSLCS